MAKKKSSPKNILTMKCKECGKETKHYLSKTGDYKCLICGTVNKSISKKKEVVFEQDNDLFEEIPTEE